MVDLTGYVAGSLRHDGARRPGRRRRQDRAAGRRDLPPPGPRVRPGRRVGELPDPQPGQGEPGPGPAQRGGPGRAGAPAGRRRPAGRERHARRRWSGWAWATRTCASATRGWSTSRSPGFGSTGPDATRGGYDLVLQAESGLLSMTGHPGQAPAKIPIAALDFGSGLYAALGALAALRERDRTGHGSHVTTSLLECALAWLSMHVVTYRLGGERALPRGDPQPLLRPLRGLPHRGRPPGGRRHRRRRRLGAPLRRPGARRTPARTRASPTTRAGSRTPRRCASSSRGSRPGAPTAHWVAVLGEAGVVCAPVQGVAAALATARCGPSGIVGEQGHPTAGPIPSVGPAAVVRRRAGRLAAAAAPAR